jgi:hypothetical protein
MRVPATERSLMTNLALAFETGNFSVVEACTDCLFAIVNGDPPVDPEWDAAEFERVCEKYVVLHGHPHSNKWFTDCSHHGKPCPDDEDCDCEKRGYSTSSCDFCGSHLHGDREDFTLIER